MPKNTDKQKVSKKVKNRKAKKVRKSKSIKKVSKKNKSPKKKSKKTKKRIQKNSEIKEQELILKTRSEWIKDSLAMTEDKERASLYITPKMGVI